MTVMQHLWVFGYGSLMWNPGFVHDAAEPAVIEGFHRALCVRSTIYRGTPERPGLVLGLDAGGTCHGMAFRVPLPDWPQALAYLRAREQVTMVYREVEVQAQLTRGGAQVTALTFVVDRAHEQYMGALALAARIALVRQGHGRSGPCRDYVQATVDHLRELNIRDADLEEVLAGVVAQDKASAS